MKRFMVLFDSDWDEICVMARGLTRRQAADLVLKGNGFDPSYPEEMVEDVPQLREFLEGDMDFFVLYSFGLEGKVIFVLI